MPPTPLEISYRSGNGRLQTSLWIPRPVDEVFELFSSAHNLSRITPGWLGLKVLSDPTIAMGVGTVIDYRFRVNGVPGNWKSLISVWEPPFRFVDEQLKGPFRSWRHEHRFTPHEGGTLAVDDVAYRVPFGKPVHALIAGRNLRRLFAHRHQAMQEIFSSHS